MSSNVSALYQNQAVTSAPGPGQPDSSGHPSVFLPTNVGLPGSFQLAPDTLISTPITTKKPASKTKKQIQKQIETVAMAFVKNGLDAAASVAAQYHEPKDGVDTPTAEELRERIEYAEAGMGETYDLFDQGKPGAIASRLLGPRAGQRYGYDEFESTVTDANGKTRTGRNCQAPNCPYRLKDRTRHQEDVHVRDPVLALYCPSGCGQVYYCGRNSEMTNHIMCYRGKQHGIVTST